MTGPTPESLIPLSTYRASEADSKKYFRACLQSLCDSHMETATGVG